MKRQKKNTFFDQIRIWLMYMQKSARFEIFCDNSNWSYRFDYCFFCCKFMLFMPFQKKLVFSRKRKIPQNLLISPRTQNQRWLNDNNRICIQEKINLIQLDFKLFSFFFQQQKRFFRTKIHGTLIVILVFYSQKRKFNQYLLPFLARTISWNFECVNPMKFRICTGGRQSIVALLLFEIDRWTVTWTLKCLWLIQGVFIRIPFSEIILCVECVSFRVWLEVSYNIYCLSCVRLVACKSKCARAYSNWKVTLAKMKSAHGNKYRQQQQQQKQWNIVIVVYGAKRHPYMHACQNHYINHLFLYARVMNCINVWLAGSSCRSLHFSWLYVPFILLISLLEWPKAIRGALCNRSVRFVAQKRAFFFWICKSE